MYAIKVKPLGGTKLVLLSKMIPLLVFGNVILMLLVNAFAQDVYYVKPNDSVACPDQPCSTLDGYAYVHRVTPYFASESRFIFLAGDHSMSIKVHLSNASNVTLRGSPDAYIIHKDGATFQCENVTNLTIERLVFVLNGVEEEDGSSAFRILNSDGIRIVDSIFQGGRNKNRSAFMRALYLIDSAVAIERCLFEGNTATFGGAISAIKGFKKLHIFRSVFINNTVGHDVIQDGGALYASYVYVNITECVFIGNGGHKGGALYMHAVSSMVVDSMFIGNYADFSGGAIYLEDVSRTIITGTQKVADSDPRCSAINLRSSTVDTWGSRRLGQDMWNGAWNMTSGYACFCNNQARFGGGITIYDSSNTVVFSGAAIMFVNNSAGGNGGGVYLINAQLLMSAEKLIFASNRAKNGGGISTESSTVVFGVNLMSIDASADYNGTAIEFISNTAVKCGGGLYSYFSDITTSETVLNFTSNSAQIGGGICIKTDRSATRFRQVEVSGDFAGNTGSCGAAIFIKSVYARIRFENVTVTRNRGSAICIRESENITFGGTNHILDNTGSLGGAVNSKMSNVSFTGYHLLANNSVTSGHGGAIYSLQDTLQFHDVALFAHNTADYDGGALYAMGSEVTFNNGANFSFNSARNGGAMYFTSTATLGIQLHLTTSYNHALGYGGAIYYEDAPTPVQCKFEMSTNQSNVGDEINELPYCFMKLNFTKAYYFGLPIYSYCDVADNAGGFLFGGLLDKCLMTYTDILSRKEERIVPFDVLRTNVFDISTSQDESITGVTSHPYEIGFCQGTGKHLQVVSRVKTVEVYRGQEFNVSLLAIAQGGIAAPTLISAMVTNTSRLELGQNLQALSHNCSELTYSVYSSEVREVLTLSPKGLCHGTGLSRALIEITFLPCPNAFKLSHDHCICDRRLQQYNLTCVIAEDVFIIRAADSRVWMRPIYDNGSYQGLALYDSCPAGYCKDQNVEITLEFPDSQCGLNRSGILCGSCAANYSLMFGSSRCDACSNTYLALLLPFAVAGIALVVFLSFFRLTVATGMINSVILYANIVQVNKYLFFPVHERNVLTVFIAWMNLDLGFETCFYDGMDAYVQTWLQFAFPIYVWVLISLIIITSRYSITVSKLVGHNPVAVLSTLLLMSYTKILKSFIAVYSYAKLDYPDNTTFNVWLMDGDVPYLESKHLILTVMTTIFFTFFFVPYTLLLLLGYKLYRFSGMKFLRWLNRIKPLLDAYYAPYNSHTRCWTGFLLLVRCALYIVFAFHWPKYTSLAITITFTALVVIWMFGRIYEKLYTNIVEVSVYFNLIVLSSTTGTNASSPALVYSLVGVVFATMVGIILYHFYLHYTDRFKWVKIIKVKILNRFQKPLTDADTCQDSIEITLSAITDYREPLLDN